MDGVFMFGQMVRSILETMSMGCGRAKGKYSSLLHFTSTVLAVPFVFSHAFLLLVSKHGLTEQNTKENTIKIDETVRACL
jgi:hypothetical protein